MSWLLIFFQIQGQLHVANMETCYFVGYISPTEGITVLKINRDEMFICNMIPKLVVFFKNSVLPEIILRRVQKEKSVYRYIFFIIIILHYEVFFLNFT